MDKNYFEPTLISKIKGLVALVVLVSCVLGLAGCASLKSGHYVQLKDGENLESLAKDFKVSKFELEQANIGRSIASGQWVYIPLKRGLLEHTRSAPKQFYFQDGQLAWPVPSSKRLTSRFGRRWGRAHEGIDIAARTGTAIVAVEEGRVVYVGNDLSGYGNLTVIAHKNGLFSIYAHAHKMYTSKGQRVHRGQVIAEVGSTGRATGPHLHFEVRYDSKALDPLEYLAYEE